VADHDAEDRATLEAHGIYSTPANKAVSPGIQAVQERLKRAGDGRPRLFIMRDARVELDDTLLARHVPTCTAEEFDSFFHEGFVRPWVLFPLSYGGQRWHSAAAMLAMAATMALLAWAGEKYAKREALGGGDIKLMIAAAGFLGWPLAWTALLLGVLLGLPIMLLYQRLHGVGWREPAPFGPALALACGIAAWDLAGGGLWLLKWDPFF
jgi:hypothetical protein